MAVDRKVIQAHKVFNRDFDNYANLNIVDLAELAYSANVICWHHHSKGHEYLTDVYTNHYRHLVDFVMTNSKFSQNEKVQFVISID